MYRYYKDFCSSSLRLLLLIETLLAAILTSFAVFMFESAFLGIMIGLLMHTILLSFADFLIFGGIGLRKQKLMEYVKSSYYGPEVIKRGIYADVAMSAIRIAVVVIIPYIVSIFAEGFSAKMLFAAISFIAVGVIALSCSLMITRRFAATLQMHMLLSYLFTTFGSIFFVPLGIMFGMDVLGSLPFAIFTLISIAAAYGIVKLMTRMCIKGFMSGYADI